MICPNCNTSVSGSYCPSCGAFVGIGEEPERKETSFNSADIPQQPESTQYSTAPNGQPIIINNYTGPAHNPNDSEKNKWVAFLLCLFFGVFGFHRFYVGKIGTGIIWLLTLGWLGIGAFIDLIIILCGGFRDTYGKPLK